MREAGKELKAFGSDETWGPFVGAISQFKQMGIGGLFSSMAQSAGLGAKNSAKFGAKIGLITDVMGQFGNEIAPVMQLLGMFGPMGIVGAGAGIAGLLAIGPEQRKGILGPFADTFEGVKDSLSGMLSGIDPGKTWAGIKSGLKSAVDYGKGLLKNLVDSGVVHDIVEGLSDAFGYVVDIFPWQKLLDGISFVIGRLGKALAKVDWSSIITGLVGSFKDIAGAVLEGAGEAFGPEGQIGAVLLGTFAVGGGAFMSALGGPGGLIAVAGAAGAIFGSKIAGHLTGGKVSGTGYGVAEGLERYSDDTLFFGMSENMSKFEEDMKSLKAALKYETEEAWNPNIEMVAKMSLQLKRLQDVRAEIMAQNQQGNIENTGSVAEGLFGMSTMMTPEEAEGVLLGGQTAADQFVSGATKSLEKGKEEIAKGAEGAASSLIAHSPIIYGPLAGEGSENAAYQGGYFTMEQFALGVTSSTDMVRMAVEDALDESVILALDTYAAKMRELAAKRTFLADVAKSMVRDLTGAQIEADDQEANVNVKKSFQAAMSLPGLASVVLAVSNEGAATRKMLKKILDENVKQTTALDGIWTNRSPAVAPTGAGPAE
jgi:hypothetical protein